MCRLFRKEEIDGVKTYARSRGSQGHEFVDLSTLVGRVFGTMWYGEGALVAEWSGMCGYF